MSLTLPADPKLYGLYRFLPPSVYGPAPQNPAPMDLDGQVDLTRVRTLANQIVTTYLNSLPSNYVSQTKGPYYVQQFQAAAEELARIQILLNDAYEDNDYDFTRPEVLFQFLATLVFSDSDNTGLPQVNGDITYREFLKRMVALLLQGSTTTTLVQGVEALTDANVSILEKFRHLQDPGILWTLADQFTFEVDVSNFKRTGPTESMSVADHYHLVTVNVTGVGVTGDALYDQGIVGPPHTHTITNFLVQPGSGVGQGVHTHDLISAFPDLPVVLQQNVVLVLQALAPASTLYEYRNLFRESFQGILTDQLLSADLESYYYEDFRQDYAGVKSIVGIHGMVGADRYLFQDPTVSFRSVRCGSELVVPVSPTPSPSSHLPRENRYTVKAVLTVPYGDDPVPRAYTTSPSNLSGFLTVAGGAFTDTSQDFSVCAPGEALTITSGPNAGQYMLETLLGLNGGPVGGSGLGPTTSVRPAPSFLRVGPRIVAPGTAIAYTVTVDRLGYRTPQSVVNEDDSSQFFGDGVETFSTLTTSFGPLVKSWGDATPAGVADVTVLYDGSPLAVSEVNPYTGLITLASPVTSFSSGAHTVTVSYLWFSTPVTGMAGLNTKGLTLNKWSLRRGRNTTSPTLSTGGYQSSTLFPMGVTLGRFANRPTALRVAHRFIGFEKGYTASLNSPTTLLLNQAPGRTSVPYAVADVSPQSFSYTGSTPPSSPWVPVGNVQGSVNNGLYTLVDNDPTAMAYWKQDLPLPTATNVSLAARFQVLGYSPDGVFTGVGFGFHNNQRLFFAGALKVTNPFTGTALRHIGLLLRPGDLASLSSWTVGPNGSGQVQPPQLGSDFGVVTLPTSSVPTFLGVGDKFQVLEGAQTGVYTVQDLYQNNAGVTFLVVLPQFPADPTVYGNRDVTLYFDTAWDLGQCTWRLYANTGNQTLSLVFGGSSGSTTSVTSGTLASPAYLGPDVLPEGYGRVLWGSFDRVATNSTAWELFRGASTPDGAYTYSRGTLVDTPATSVDPEDAEWYLETPFGDSNLAEGYLTMTSTPANSGLGTFYGYGYVDPFLNGRRVVALDALFEVERDTAGVGGVTMTFRDTHREVTMATIRYQDNGSLGKVIYALDTVSLVGSTPYYLQGWGGSAVTQVSPNGPEILLTGDGVTPWDVYTTLTPYSSPCTGRFLEFKLAIPKFTYDGSGRIGFTLAAVFGAVTVFIEFRAGGLVLCNNFAGGVALAMGVPWTDGVARIYRVEFDGGTTLGVFLDDQLIGSAPLSAFASVPLNGNVMMQMDNLGGTFTGSLSALCYGGTETGISDLHRTLGLYLGGDQTDLNNWALPRTDGGMFPNSDPSSVITEMDWTVPEGLWVRIFLDPTFGAALIRPDLNPPPGYTGSFATQSMDPSAGWVTVEYARLPRTPTTKFGSVAFGALNPSGSVVCYWENIRYRVFTNTSVDYTAPQGMVLNRWNVITSGDFLKDTTPQEVVVSSVTSTRVSLRPCHIFADRVFAVRVSGVTIPQNLWSFNKDSQDIVLTVGLPSANYPVNVVFAPARPVTNTYLQSQPIGESQTVLNEGTPPIQMSQVGTFSVSTVSGDGGPTPAFPPAGPGNPSYFLNDQYLVQGFEASELYETMEFFQLPDSGVTGRIASYNDGPGLGEGLSYVLTIL